MFLSWCDIGLLMLGLCLVACPLMLMLALAGLCLRMTRDWSARVLYRGACGLVLCVLAARLAAAAWPEGHIGSWWLALPAGMVGFGAWSLGGCVLDLLRREWQAHHRQVLPQAQA